MKKIASVVAALGMFVALTASTPARADMSICSIDPNTSSYSWFAHVMGMCNN